MDIIKKYKYILIAAIVALAAGLLLVNNNQNSEAVSLMAPTKTTVKLQSQDTLTNLFKANNIIDNTNVSSVEINIVDSIAEPMFVQSDKDGELIVSSRFDIDETTKVATVTISLGDFVKNLSAEEQVSWLDSEFFKNADIIVKRNLKADRAEIPRMKVFMAI